MTSSSFTKQIKDVLFFHDAEAKFPPWIFTSPRFPPPPPFDIGSFVSPKRRYDVFLPTISQMLGERGKFVYSFSINSILVR